jgi:lysophospholipase L1-like esterase
MQTVSRALLCLGDSNTWGSVPMDHLDDVHRFAPHERWPGVLRGQLDASWQVIEEGLPGRTLARDDPVEGEDRNALRLLRALLESHRPLVRLIVMLGTNDLKARFGASPAQVADGLHALLDGVQACAWPGLPAPPVLIVCPPPVDEVGCLAPMFVGAAAKARELAPLYAQVAGQRGADFFDAGTVASVAAHDGIHLDLAAHRALGRALAQWLRGRA